jgi:hypothetical protein
VPLESIRAEYVRVGTFDTAAQRLDLSGEVRFASGQLATPSDGSDQICSTFSSARANLKCGVTLQIGVMCAWRPGPGQRYGREVCDHAFHTIDRINNKTDGFYDSLLPGAIIEAREVRVGCSEGRAINGLEALRADNVEDSSGNLTAVIGPGCSNDVAAVTSVAARAAGGYDTLIISGMSTAPSLANESAFPNLARMSTSEVLIGVAMARLVAHFEWRRVVVVHDGTVWGRESAAAFCSSFASEVPGGIVLNPHTMEVSVRAFDAGELNITDVLDEIARVRGRIVYAAVNPRLMGCIFSAFDSRVRDAAHPWFHSRDAFAWLLSWASQQMFYNSVCNANALTMALCGR